MEMAFKDSNENFVFYLCSNRSARSKAHATISVAKHVSFDEMSKQKETRIDREKTMYC